MRLYLALLSLIITAAPAAAEPAPPVDLERLEARVGEELLKDGLSLDRLGVKIDLQALGEGCVIELLETHDNKSVAIRKLTHVPPTAEVALAELTVVAAEMIREHRGLSAPTASVVGKEVELEPAGVLVRIVSDDPDVELYEHVGTSVGTGNVGGEVATVTSVHVERLCKAPCDRRIDLSSGHELFLSGVGVTTSDLFSVNPSARAVRLDVKAGNGFVHFLGYMLGYTGLTAAVTGAVFAAIGGSLSVDLADPLSESGGFQPWHGALIGGGVGAAVLGLVLAMNNTTELEIHPDVP